MQADTPKRRLEAGTAVAERLHVLGGYDQVTLALDEQSAHREAR